MTRRLQHLAGAGEREERLTALETLSATSERVPVGATEVSSALWMACVAIRARTSSSSPETVSWEIGTPVEQGECALLPG